MKTFRLILYLCSSAFICGCVPSAYAQCPQSTTVADTLYNANGTLAEGRLVIAWQTFSIGSCQVPAGQATVNVAAGALNVQLYPNITATPSGTSYRITYYLKSGRITTEYWVVPASATPVGLAAVRSATVPVPNVMFSQSQVTNLSNDLLKKVELPSPCVSGKFLQSNGSAAPPQVNCVDAPGGGGGSGTVTSVGLSAPAQFSVSGSPVTTSGTLGLAWLSQNANQIFAGPTTGAAAAPAFRGLAPTDLALSTRGDLLIVNSSPALARLAVGAGGTFLRSSGADPSWQLIAAADIPSLEASKIATGSFPDARVDDSITLANLTQITTRNYSDLQNIPSTFAPAAHSLDGAAHTVSGLTTGHYLRVNSATTFGFAQIAFSELTSSVTDAQVPNNITVDLAAAATALAANGGNCTNQFLRGVDAAGAAEGCATVAKADAAATFVHTDQANNYSAGFKQTFAPNATNAGLNLGSVSGDPSTLANGDMWYDSSGGKFRCRESGTSKDCIGAGGGTHDILSATHTDTTAAAVTRGAGMFGIGATPKWEKVATTTTDRYFKRNSSGDIVESSSAAAGTGSCTNQFVRGNNADAAPTCATVGTADVSSAILTDTMTVTRDFPLNCTHARVKSLAGNAFFDVEGLSTGDYDIQVAKFLNNVDGRIQCGGFVPNELAATPAAKIIFDVQPHVACGGSTNLRFNVRYRFYGDAGDSDASMTAESEQSLAGPTTAHRTVRGTFPSGGSLSSAPSTGNNVQVEIQRNGASASDTCEQTAEVLPGSVKLRVDVKVKT